MSHQRSERVIRRILHVDMDAFYASVEQRDNPSLKGRPVAVGGDPVGRGVVAAASYEARAFGVRSAIPMARAVRLCPQLVIVRPEFERYRAVSNTVFDIFRSITPLVEPLSLDEAYLDVTENAWGEPLGMRVAAAAEGRDPRGDRAHRLRRRGAEQVPGEDRVGLAQAGRPDGDCARARRELSPGAADRRAVGRRPGHRAQAARAGHREAGGRARRGRSKTCAAIVGSAAEWLQQLAHGIDDRPVEPNRPRKSVGSENTFARDLLDLADIRRAVDEMARDVAAWLTRKGVFGRTVTLKIRYSDFTTCTRSHSEPRATQNADAIAARALALLEKTDAGRRPVRLLGVSVHNLQEVEETVRHRR